MAPDQGRARRRPGRLSSGCDLPSTGNWDSGNPAFALSRGSHDGPPSTPSRCPSLAWHAVVPFTFRIQVSQQTQEPPSEVLPAEPGIQPGASWRTASGRRPGSHQVRRGPRRRHSSRPGPGRRLRARMGCQPGGKRVSRPVRQDLHRAAGLHVNQQRPVGMAAAQRELIDPQHLRRHGRGRVG